MRVLIADDHPFLRAGVESVLRDAGMDIAASVDDGETALEAIARENPDIVILDVRMPGLGGVGVVQAMRAANDERPVILLTAELDDTNLLAAMKAGVEGIVFKHGAEDRLIDAIKVVSAGGTFIDRTLTERAMQLVQTETRRSPFDSLSAREKQIAVEVARGKRNRDIAELVGMTEGSIKVYLHNIYGKLAIENRTELAILAIEEGLV